jgi:sulfite exporter TauE/SafE
VTVSAYFVGSILGGAFAGGLSGALGAAADVGSWSVEARLLVVGAALLVGLAFDVHLLGLQLPTVHRQVEERWRERYRGWVWGFAFGFQLALGVVTIVTTSSVYVTWLAAALTGSSSSGAAIGVAFGLARALPILAVATVRSPGQLFRVDATLQLLAAPARRLTYVAGSALSAACVAGVLR